jgi:hypothetical protein
MIIFCKGNWCYSFGRQCVSKNLRCSGGCTFILWSTVLSHHTVWVIVNNFSNEHRASIFLYTETPRLSLCHRLRGFFLRSSAAVIRRNKNKNRCTYEMGWMGGWRQDFPSENVPAVAVWHALLSAEEGCGKGSLSLRAKRGQRKRLCSTKCNPQCPDALRAVFLPLFIAVRVYRQVERN